MPIEPQPCGSGAGEAGPDVEQVLLCDLLPDGSIAGTALAVYEYDETGNPVGPPTFVDPATGLPYVAQGILQPCPGDVGCGAPTQFCFQSTAPVDQPGRMYDTVLTMAQGFAVQGLVKDLVDTPLNITWQVTDPDGTQFASDLQTALQSQFPGQTVTVTPGAVDVCAGGTAGFAVHIECLRLDQSPPSLLQFRYNAGRDLVINPGFVTTPPMAPTDPLTFVKRADVVGGAGTRDVLCTSVANRGWETNDSNRAFELWGTPPGSPQNVVEGTTPTPRGTAVQEINAFGSGPVPTTGANAGNPAYGSNPDTIWQTFNVPAAGNFVIKVVVGGRASTENIPIKLSTGDVGDAGIGDVINTSVNALKVTTEGATPAAAWTTFTQTVPLAAGLYTLAFTGPENPITTDDNAFGGLFTDMRVYQDAPNTVQAFTNDDDTCTVPTTSTSSVCEYWAPRCSGGEIVGWYNVADGQDLTNAQFWAQVPAPTCCSSSSEGGSSSTGNLVYTYLVCGTLNGETRTMSRVVVSDQAGGIIADSFIDTDGGPVTPDTWQPGDCSTAEQPLFAGFVCDVFGGTDVIPATLPTCPGSPTAAPLGLAVGTGMTEGPAGTYTQTANAGASLTWNRSPNDDQHAICSVKFVNDPGSGDDLLWQLFGSFVDINGTGVSLNAVWITAVEAALGVGDLTDIPPGSTATVSAGGTDVTITFDGPSPHSQMWAGNGVFFVREQDGDGLAAGVTLEFDPPVRSFTLAPNVTAPTPGSFSGLQESRAAPGTAAIPAAPPSVTEVKQFRNPDGTAFYENLDGTPHTVLGAVGECGTFFQEQLCDSPTGVPFVRVYKVTGGAVSGFQDYDLAGTPYAVVGAAARCETEVADLRLVEHEVLCYTAADGVTVTQFLRRYLMDQDGVAVIAVLDTLLDGFTPFVTLVGGTVALCSADGGSAGLCSTASSIGTVCYTPPMFVPAMALSDDWAGSVVVGANGGPQTITNPDFDGSGRTVEMTLNKGAGLTGASVLLGNAPTVANALYHQHLDLGGNVTGLDVTFNSFGTLGNEILRNISPPVDSITGAGTLVLGNTGVNPTASNGTVTLHWNGPLSFVDFDWRSVAGGTLSTIGVVAFTTVASGSSTATSGTAAVLVDCETGAVTYRDLATGLVFDLSTVTIVDCATSSETPESLVLCDVTQVPGLDGARSPLNLTTLPAGPTAGAFPNGINFTVDQGLAGGSGTYLINASSTQHWTFSEPAMLRFGVNNLNVGAECVTLPVGTVVESIHANHTYNPLTRVLCNGGAALGGDESIFTLDAATTLAIASNPGGGGQRGLVRLEAGRTTFTEVRTPFLRTICRTCGAAPVITDTGMDGLTPYVPAGTVGVCDVPFTPVTAVTGDTEILPLCDDGTDPAKPFLRRLTFDATGTVTATTDTLYDGSAYALTGDAVNCPAGCDTASAIGTVCYTPPVAVQTLQDDWTGTTSVAGGGSRVWTNSNFAGAGITVTETVTPDTTAALLANGVRNTAISPASQHTAIDLGAPRTNVTVRLDFFGSGQGERLRNISPAYAGVSGNGTAVLANTGVDGGPAADGTIFLLFAGPVQNISWDYAPTGGGLSGQSFISFNTGNASNSAPAAVLRDCDTGATTFVDLATGTVLNPAAISIVDCPGETDTTAEANPQIDSTLQRQTGAGAVNIPAGARSVTVTVVTGTPTVAIGGGAAVTLAAGMTLTWAVDRGGPDGETLQDAFVVTGLAGHDFLVHTTREI